MNDNCRESLSALMDDEASGFEVRRLLERLDDGHTAAWSRYQLARELLKGDVPTAPPAFAAGVSAALNDEPRYGRSRLGGGAWKPLVSVGVAASVTALMIFGAQSMPVAAPESPPLAQNSRVLPAPTPAYGGLMPAQYGRAPADVSVVLKDIDVIRLSSGMHQYIDRHQALLQTGERAWTAGWVPDGFTPVRHEIIGGSEVMLYSNGRSTLSVGVEPLGRQKARAGVVQQGETVALGKAVGGHFITVVGDVPLMIADRIASSVDSTLN